MQVHMPGVGDGKYDTRRRQSAQGTKPASAPLSLSLSLSQQKDHASFFWQPTPRSLKHHGRRDGASFFWGPTPALARAHRTYKQKH